MSQWKHLGTVKVRKREYRFVLDTHSHFGCYSPELHVYLSGPNGSKAGFGPLGWSRRWKRFFPYYSPGNEDTKQQWSSMLSFKVPHLPFRYSRGWPGPLRRVYLLLYIANYRLLDRMVK